MDTCGNCGAPLDLDEDGVCRWCRAKVRARTRPSFHGGRRGISWRWNRTAAAISAIAIGLAAGLGIGIASYVGSHQSGPPTATSTGSSAAESVAPGSTDLQALRLDFGPWRQLADGPTDSPALLLLENGAAYASEQWAVPSGATWWAQDLGGNVTSVTRSGDHAIIEPGLTNVVQVAVLDPATRIQHLASKSNQDIGLGVNRCTLPAVVNLVGSQPNHLADGRVG